MSTDTDVVDETAVRATLTVNIRSRVTSSHGVNGIMNLAVKLGDSKLPCIKMQNVGGLGSNTYWSECRGVIEDVPVGETLSVSTIFGTRHFRVERQEASLTIDGDLTQAVGLAEIIKTVYTCQIRGMRKTFTAFASKHDARESINRTLCPALVSIQIGDCEWYDAYPAGHPIPDEAYILERCDGRQWSIV